MSSGGESFGFIDPLFPIQVFVLLILVPFGFPNSLHWSIMFDVDLISRVNIMAWSANAFFMSDNSKFPIVSSFSLMGCSNCSRMNVPRRNKLQLCPTGLVVVFLLLVYGWLATWI